MAKWCETMINQPQKQNKKKCKIMLSATIIFNNKLLVLWQRRHFLIRLLDWLFQAVELEIRGCQSMGSKFAPSLNITAFSMPSIFLCHFETSNNSIQHAQPVLHFCIVLSWKVPEVTDYLWLLLIIILWYHDYFTWNSSHKTMLTISVFLNISSPYLTQISISRHMMALKQIKTHWCSPKSKTRI